MSEAIEEIRGLVRDIVGERSVPDEDRSLSIWADVREAGLHRVGISEDNGGSGGSLGELDEMVVASVVPTCRSNGPRSSRVTRSVYHRSTG